MQGSEARTYLESSAAGRPVWLSRQKEGRVKQEVSLMLEVGWMQGILYKAHKRIWILHFFLNAVGTIVGFAPGQWRDLAGTFKGSLQLLCWEIDWKVTRVKEGMLWPRQDDGGKREMMMVMRDSRIRIFLSKRELRITEELGWKYEREESGVIPLWGLNNWVNYNPITLDQGSANFFCTARW